MISLKSSLLLQSLYSYDIVSAYPTILQKQYYDFNDIDLDNKKDRNIFIGTRQKDNENLSSFLIKSAESLISYYLIENNVSEDEIIITQRDGFIITKLLDFDDDFIDMKYRGFIDFLIISDDRKKYLYLMDDEIVVKGMPFYYDSLHIFYDLFKNLNFYDKSILFSQLENIKKNVLNSQNKKAFLIPKNEQLYNVITYKKIIEIKDPDYISIEDIDRKRYFEHYINCFLKSIFLECY